MALCWKPKIIAQDLNSNIVFMAFITQTSREVSGWNVQYDKEEVEEVWVSEGLTRALETLSGAESVVPDPNLTKWDQKRDSCQCAKGSQYLKEDAHEQS